MRIDFQGALNGIFGDNAKTRFKRITTLIVILGGFVFLSFNLSMNFEWRGFSCGVKPIPADVKVDIKKGQ